MPPPVQTYQYVMVDPTASFDFLVAPDEPMAQPSDSNQVSDGDIPPTSAT